MQLGTSGQQRKTLVETSTRSDAIEAVDAYVRRALEARADQGLAASIEDAATLEQLAILLYSAARPARQPAA